MDEADFRLIAIICLNEPIPVTFLHNEEMWETVDGRESDYDESD